MICMGIFIGNFIYNLLKLIYTYISIAIVYSK